MYVTLGSEVLQRSHRVGVLMGEEPRCASARPLQLLLPIARWQLSIVISIDNVQQRAGDIGRKWVDEKSEATKSGKVWKRRPVVT